MRKKVVINLILIFLVVVLAVIPLLVAKGAGFGGADDRAKDAISEINAEYKPWFSSIWEPPSSEISGLLFALQAAIGSGVLFYCLGYMKGRSKNKSKPDKNYD